MTTRHYRHKRDVLLVVEGLIDDNNRSVDPLDSYSRFTTDLQACFPKYVRSMHVPARAYQQISLSVHVCPCAWAVFLHVLPQRSQEEAAANGAVHGIPGKHCLSLLVVAGSPAPSLVDPCAIHRLLMEQTPRPAQSWILPPASLRPSRRVAVIVSVGN